MYARGFNFGIQSYRVRKNFADDQRSAEDDDLMNIRGEHRYPFFISFSLAKMDTILGAISNYHKTLTMLLRNRLAGFLLLRSIFIL